MGNSNSEAKTNLLWLVYAALIIAGIILLADALHFHFLNRLSVRLGVAFIFSAIALISGKDRPAAIIAIGLVWIAVIITFFSR